MTKTMDSVLFIAIINYMSLSDTKAETNKSVLKGMVKGKLFQI
jgi:hypothetical protein